MSHDVDHNSFTNIFHVRTKSKLACTYNDVSVLENHHASLGWKIAKETGLLSSLSREERETFREIFIHCILSTDMSLHHEHLEYLLTLADYHSSPMRKVPDNLLAPEKLLA